MRDRPFIKERCGYTRLILRECKRSDARLFDFYSAICSSTDDVGAWVARARQAFPPLPGPSITNLVGCHNRRLQLNATLQEIYKPSDAVWVEPDRTNAQHNKPQGMWLWQGQELICACRGRAYRHQGTYIVKELSSDGALMRQQGSDDTVPIAPLSRVASMFRLPFARTYHSAQGLSFDRVRLWDCDKVFFTTAHLVVGMSLCRSSECLDFGQD
jgi:hypothetical protein